MEKRLSGNAFLRALLACMMGVLPFCMSLNAQVLEQTKITAVFRQEPVSLRLKGIQEKTGLTIAFEEKDVLRKTAVAASFENASLQKVLQQSLKGFSLSYKEMNGMVVVYSQPVANLTDKKNGTVSGIVVDEENGEPVVGATVTIGNQNKISDVDGSFIFELPEGTYIAAITSVGYGAKNVTEILVKGSQAATVNITLKRQKGNLQGVVVSSSARKETVASLYIRQKNNAGITDGISAEQISRTPDKNIGESLKRISGLSAIDNKYVVVRGLSERYNQAMLNGQAMPSTELNRKQFSFDIIPSNMVDNITVSKTITPDKSAEFGGGLVEINTKDIPSENFLNVTAGTSVNDRTSGKDMLSLRRDGNKGYLGQYAAHRYLAGQKNWNSLQDIRDAQAGHASGTLLTNNWQPYYYGAMPSQNYQVSFGRVMPTIAGSANKLGVLASVSYRNTQSIQGLSTIRNNFPGMLEGDQFGFSTSLGGMLGVGYTTKNHKISWQNLFTQLLDEQMNYGVGLHAELGANSRAMIEKVQQTTLWQSQLKGEHSLGTKGIKVNWTGSYTQVKRVRPDNHVILWRAPENISAPHNEFNVAEWHDAGAGAATPSDPGALRLFSDAMEKNFGWDANIQIPFHLGNTKNSFKTGYAGWVKDRQFYVAMLADHANHESSVAAYPPLGDLFSPKYGGGRSSVAEFGDDYKKKAPLHAVYGMFDNRIANKLRLVWGLRAEYFNMDKANQVIDGTIKEVSSGTDLDDFSALRNTQKSWQLFPSANITYSLTPKVNIRAAYAKSIIRPDLRELAYFREYDFELGGIYQADFLRATKLDNYDFRVEWYPGAGEVLSASFFYKNVKYPMEIYNNITTYNLQNNYKSNNRGIELEVRKSLAFIDVPVIKNMTVYGNFTTLMSKVTPMQVKIGAQDPTNVHKLTYQMIPGPEEKRPLMGQSNNMGNAGLYYDNKHLRISVNYNSVSNRLVIYDVTIRNWQFERPMRSLDAQLAYRFLHQRAEVKVNLSNLLNESIITYVNSGTPQEVEEVQKGNYSQKYLLYDKDKDVIVQKITPGRTYGLSINLFF